MNQTVEMHLKINAEIKEKAEQIFKKLGWTLEEAIVLLLEETVKQGKPPEKVLRQLGSSPTKETG